MGPRPSLTLFPQIDRYLTRLVLVPLLGTLCLAAMLLTLDRMLRLLDFVVREGGPVTVVWRMLANLIPEYLGLAIPVGLTLGVLLAFRKLALSSELDTLRAVGLGYGRLLRVPYLFALVLMVVNLWVVGFIQPTAQYSYQNLRYELSSGALGASIKVGEFTQFGRRMTLRIERSENHGTDLYGVFLRMIDRNGRSIAATADRGRFLATEDPDTIVFRLTNGRLVNNQADYRVPRVLTFAQHNLPINMPATGAFRARGGTRAQELTIAELWQQSGDPGISPQFRNEVRANLHFRLVEVAMMLLVPLLAVALAVPPKRSTSGLGIFVSIIFVVTYHKVNQYGQQMGALGRFDPLIALWVPFAIFGGLILWMYWTLAHKPGGQPIGALERAAARVAKLFRRLLRRDRRLAAAA